MSKKVRGGVNRTISGDKNSSDIKKHPGSVIRATTRGPLTPAAMSLASVMLATGAASAQETTLPTIDVLSTQGGYQTITLGVSRFPTPLIDTPQSITVVPQKIISEQNSTTVMDALRNVAGITFRAGEGGNMGDTPYIRGFDARNDIFRDGVRDPGWYTRDSFAIENVEVYKGPSSFLFGRGSTGGVVNLTTRLPQDRTFVDGEVIGTSAAGIRGTVDANAKMNERWSARIQVMGQDYPSPGRDHVDDKRWGIAPSISGKITEQTKVTFSHILQHDNLIPDRGIPFLPATFGLPRVPAPVERDTFYGILGGRNPDTEQVDANISTARIEHEFAPNITLKNTSRYVTVDRFSRVTLPNNFTPPVGGLGTYFYRPGRQQQTIDNELMANQTDFAARFATGMFQHSLTTGLDLNREERTQVATAYTANSAAATSVFNPDASRDGGTFGAAGAPSRALGTTVGVYAADHIKITEYFELLGGLRHDTYEANATTATTNLSRTDDMLSWRVGLVFHPVPNTSIYVMHGTAFNPSAEFLTLAAANANLGPEQNQTTEVGAKADVLNGRLSLSAAVFRTVKTNARIPDPTNTAVNILDGVTRIQGVEAGVAGKITAAWEMFANVTFLDSEIVSTSTAAQLGNELLNTPKSAFSMWTTYAINDKLTVGGGAYYVGKVWANVDNTAMVPDYWRFDAMASYKLAPKTTLQLNIYNILNEYYFGSIYNNWAVPGPGRYASLSLKVRY